MLALSPPAMNQMACVVPLQLGNLERKWQHHEQNNFAMKECILIAQLDDKPLCMCIRISFKYFLEYYTQDDYNYAIGRVCMFSLELFIPA